MLRSPKYLSLSLNITSCLSTNMLHKILNRNLCWNPRSINPNNVRDSVKHEGNGLGVSEYIEKIIKPSLLIILISIYAY